MQYRGDIQFLRGIAVSLVFIFHLNIPIFRSGFIGVDIFFVISGFLMAMTLNAIDSNSITAFYIRRLKRIMPAYLAVLSSLVILSPILFIPPHVDEVLRDVPMFLAGLPNIAMWMQTDYWRNSNFVPALHFWSLGVELQFYLILPLIVWLHLRSSVYTLAIFILSLTACAVVQFYSPKTAFFLMPFRIWEFTAGFYLAKYGSPFQRKHGLLSSAVLFYGAVIVLLVLATAPMPPQLFPWPWAAPVVAATVVLIGCAYRARSRIERAVFAAVEWLGELSYSIYLVHFPIIIILTYQPFSKDAPAAPSVSMALQATGLTLGLAMLSYYAIERPLRRGTYTRPGLAYGALGAMVALSLSGSIWADAAMGLRRPPPREVAAVYAAMADKSDTFRCSLISLLTEPLSPFCTLADAPDAGRHPTVLVVGNSHADAIKEVLREEALRRGVRLLLMRQNSVAGGSGIPPERLRQIARAYQIDYLLLHSRAAPDRAARETSLLGDVLAMAETEGITVLFLEPVPTWSVSIPQAAYNTATVADAPPLPVQTISTYKQKHRDLLQFIESIKSPHFVSFSPSQTLCNPHCQIVNDNGALLYHDEHHLTLSGARYIRGVIADIFQFVADDFNSHRAAK